MKKKIALAGMPAITLMSLLLLAAQPECTGQDLKGKRVLIVFGGWDGHEPG